VRQQEREPGVVIDELVLATSGQEKVTSEQEEVTHEQEGVTHEQEKATHEPSIIFCNPLKRLLKAIKYYP